MIDSMPQVLSITSLDELRSFASAWDDLWRRSDVTLPMARAEMIAQWVEEFSPEAEFRALVVEDGGRWLAALPLISRRKAGLGTIGALPTNEWPSGAELLWDNAAVGDARIGDAFLDALRHLPWQLLLLDGMMPGRPAWQSILRQMASAGMTCDLRTRWRAGRLEIHHDWQHYLGGLSRKHRQRIASRLRRLAARGEVQFQLLSQIPPDAVEPWLTKAFEIEDCGWKGDAGTSVMKTPGIFNFLLRQGRQLATWGQLEVALLSCGDRPVAFCYGASAKGVFHSCKIGYDPAYAEFSPGHLLQYHLLQAFHSDPRRLVVDYQGPATEYHVHWRPATYAIARLAVSPRGLAGRMALWGYRLFQGRDDLLEDVVAVGYSATDSISGSTATK